MNGTARRVLAAAIALPAATVVSHAPAASAATVLAVEGTLQPTRTTQTAFNGAFCAQNTCRSINNARTPFDVRPGSLQLQAALDSTPGDVILMGFSLGAASIYDRLREWEDEPDLAPDPQRLRLIVTFGNPENKYGGDDRGNPYAGLPEVQPYPHLDVTMQYDSVADRATRWGWYSAVNSAFARHFDYFKPSDINDPDNLVYRDDGGTTYMLIEADVLPMLKWMAGFVPAERMAELDAKYRPLVERDYDRPEYVEQGAGADWGNGNLPPALAGGDDPAGQDEQRLDDSGSETTTLGVESQPSDHQVLTRRTDSDADDDEAVDEIDDVEASDHVTEWDVARLRAGATTDDDSDDAGHDDGGEAVSENKSSDSADGAGAGAGQDDADAEDARKRDTGPAAP
ncbi:Uncharacterised protein [Mycolicibacterium vanbaalenii]|uniref:PE-PPE domain-containing protein n=1 Tax=Mycolicibacterium vanbaalenii TaxID=110539 RepID=A0A5S9QF88_MYCVN|nr:PE-PPE domain-containing protein [Mycolicibacterium vanbaalenii]CAA0116516.1 Uncharacterised protein [Mycolicibacterium vanbaalenii]